MADLFRRFIDDQETGCLRRLDAALMVMLMLGELCKAQELHEISHQERLADTIESYMVADACGFRDVGYFRRVFKGLVGMTPTRFRQLHGHAHINTH